MKENWNLKKHMILSALVAGIFKWMGSLLQRGREASSIGIIGGVDGPTAIYITKKATGYILWSIPGIAVFLLGMVLYRPVKRTVEGKQKKQ